MRLHYIFAVILTAMLWLTPSAVQAQDYFDGWYYDAQESGWGINVEVQGDIMFLALFTYRKNNGKPIWFTGVDSNFSYAAAVFEADLERFVRGACFTCPYSPPEPGVLGDGGHIRIAFNNQNHVVVTWKGRTATLERFYWAYRDNTDFLFGIWAVVRGFDLVFADYYYFDERLVDDRGNPFLGGISSGGNIVVASYDPGLENYGMLERVTFSDGTTADWFYVFVMTKEQMIGSYWILDPGELPTGQGTDFVAFRFGQQMIAGKRDSNAEALKRMELNRYPPAVKSVNLDAAELYGRLLSALD